MIKYIKLLRRVNSFFRDNFRLIKYGDISDVSFFDSATTELIKKKSIGSIIYSLSAFKNNLLEYLSTYQISQINENRVIRADDNLLELNRTFVKCSLNNQWKNAFILIDNASGQCDLILDEKNNGIYLFIGRLLSTSKEGTLKIFLNNGKNSNKIFDKPISTLPKQWNLFHYKFKSEDIKLWIKGKTTIRWELESKKGKIFFGAPVLGKKRKKNKKVLVLILDALRPKDLGVYNSKINFTPGIDSFFKDGAIFLNSFSQSNWTLPTFASMATSKYASNHCVVDPDKYSIPMSRKIKLLAEKLQENGIYTYADMAHRRCNQSLGHHRGYYHFHYQQGGTGGNSTIKQIDKACNLFNNMKDVPIFSFVHIFDTHFPYLQDDSIMIDSHLNISEDVNKYYLSGNKYENTNFSYDMIKNIYHAKLNNVDEHLKRLFNLCKKHNVTVILTSDHGNSFRNVANGMNSLSSNNIQTPFLIKSPELPIVGGKYSNIVESSVDLCPTILNIYNLEPPTHCEGSSIFNKNWEVQNKKNGISEVLYKDDYQLKIINQNKSSVLFRTTRNRSTGKIDFKNLTLTKFDYKDGNKNQDMDSFKSYLKESRLSKKLKRYASDLI